MMRGIFQQAVKERYLESERRYMNFVSSKSAFGDEQHRIPRDSVQRKCA